MTNTLSGRTAVVTGGARGIGLTLARSLAADGMDIALFDLLDSVDDAARQITDDYGVKASGHRVDVTDQAVVADAFRSVGDQLGIPQALVTAAGIEINGDSVDVTAEQWRKVIDVNLSGTFFAAQAFGEGLLRASLPGSAVLVASMSGSIVNVPQWAASYNASKAAVAHLGKSLAVEWAAAGIRVNSISPGYVLTDLTRAILDQQPELREGWVEKIPQKRMAAPEDLTGLVNFLASDASSYLTAQDIVIDGGYTAL
ncbi:NAD(P)-dependent dehydrogenase (short-subunit alcohol dehydrogenase family) [Nocardioides albertanoniae]|uniref:NAD(P)-dependent dehydrogenase (Short-subunit alcohol dehydrogenase family) n=1 Tax=Nocardioides albertanoniae TaxID=1175486 RepID=A0A543A471_9ACTN|nr:SDR family oxidoreductase [Nocardioides albertanoniae]TQL67378.1 NAD(P)-dependent dehydrogenase (short-subunit alcohol dehydrogenase family) [Nocardioides albertanoniae]